LNEQKENQLHLEKEIKNENKNWFSTLAIGLFLIVLAIAGFIRE